MTNQASEEIRSKIKTAQFDLAGRMATHIQVARRSGWTPSELDGVHEGDQIIFENDILALIRTEKLKLLAEVREQTTIFKIKAHDKKGQPHLYEAGRGVPTDVLNRLEAEL